MFFGCIIGLGLIALVKSTSFTFSKSESISLLDSEWYDDDLWDNIQQITTMDDSVFTQKCISQNLCVCSDEYSLSNEYFVCDEVNGDGYSANIDENVDYYYEDYDEYDEYGDFSEFEEFIEPPDPSEPFYHWMHPGTDYNRAVAARATNGDGTQTGGQRIYHTWNGKAFETTDKGQPKPQRTATWFFQMRPGLKVTDYKPGANIRAHGKLIKVVFDQGGQRLFIQAGAHAWNEGGDQEAGHPKKYITKANESGAAGIGRELLKKLNERGRLTITAATLKEIARAS